jgi:hypothetical protein
MLYAILGTSNVIYEPFLCRFPPVGGQLGPIRIGTKAQMTIEAQSYRNKLRNSNRKFGFNAKYRVVPIPVYLT